jgi:flavin reductase (DIM6/NTAB) family NADH-FMN oxidoreductase RutF
MTDGDTDDLDAFLSGVDYPMFVVTVEHDGQRDGCLVGFVTQASIDPQRLLVCLSVANRTYELARDSGSLAVHLLCDDQHELATLFGSTTGDDIDKFSRCRWEPGPDGLPLLVECPAWMTGTILERIPLGDHVGFLIAPSKIRRRSPEAGPVMTYQQVKDMPPGHPA